MVQKVKDLFSRTGESIKGFGSDPINNLGFLIPMAICLTSIISGIVTYIMFIVNGGYSSQVGSIKQNGLDGISEGFTSGTTGMMVLGIVSKIFLALVAVEFIVMLINYFKNRGKGMRIAMIVDLVVMGIVIALSTVVFWIAVGELVFSEEQIYQALGRFEGVTINLRAVLIAYVAVTLVAVICFIVFTLITAECRWMVGYTALSLVFANIVMPLFFLILQNIIPLVSGAVALVIIGLIIFVVIKVIASGDGATGSSSSSSSSGGGYQSTAVSNGRASTNVRRWDITEDAIITVETDIFGVKIIKAYGKYMMGDKYEKEITTPLGVEVIGHASYDDLKNGSLIITVKGKRITERDVIFK